MKYRKVSGQTISAVWSGSLLFAFTPKTHFLVLRFIWIFYGELLYPVICQRSLFIRAQLFKANDIVNDSLKFISSDMQICCNFLLKKKVSSFCSAKATHIFSAKNIRMLCIESTKTVNEMTLNELVKLMMLWTTGPRSLAFTGHTWSGIDISPIEITLDIQIVPPHWGLQLTLVLLNPDISCLCKQCRSRSVGFWRSEPALFAV